MRVALLYPHFDHPAIEERYGSWQAQLFLRRAREWDDSLTYLPDEKIGSVVDDVEAEYCLVVTDPLLLATRATIEALTSAMTADIVATIPVTNEPAMPAQAATLPRGYLTIRQFEEVAAEMLRSSEAPRTTVWSGDPGLYLCRTDILRDNKHIAAHALDNHNVAVVPRAYTHRWTRMRAQSREDLLPRIPLDARNILEFGCAEGILGQDLKRRQKCRVVGIELDQRAAAVARKRLDDVYCGDATHLIEIMNEQFDCIIGGDVLEHLDDPWSFLMQLRNVATDGATLILSVPNIGNWAILSDLLQGRFDYAYLGIACAGHMRFFTRTTIADTLAVAGWRVVSVEPQAPLLEGEAQEFIRRLEASGLAPQGNDLLAPGFYVVGRNEQ